MSGLVFLDGNLVVSCAQIVSFDVFRSLTQVYQRTFSQKEKKVYCLRGLIKETSTASFSIGKDLQVDRCECSQKSFILTGCFAKKVGARSDKVPHFIASELKCHARVLVSLFLRPNNLSTHTQVRNCMGMTPAMKNCPGKDFWPRLNKMW